MHDAKSIASLILCRLSTLCEVFTVFKVSMDRDSGAVRGALTQDQAFSLVNG